MAREKEGSATRTAARAVGWIVAIPVAIVLVGWWGSMTVWFHGSVGHRLMKAGEEQIRKANNYRPPEEFPAFTALDEGEIEHFREEGRPEDADRTEAGTEAELEAIRKFCRERRPVGGSSLTGWIVGRFLFALGILLTAAFLVSPFVVLFFVGGALADRWELWGVMGSDRD